MKKRLLIITAILTVTILTFSACSPGFQPPSISPAWLYAHNEATVDEQGYKYEKTEYRVEIDKDYKFLDETRPRLAGTGSYVSTIKWKSPAGSDGQQSNPESFIVETLFTFTGQYVTKDSSYTSETFTDTIATSAEFKSGGSSYFPVKSSRITKSTIYYAKDAKYQIKQLDYKEEFEYDKDVATAKLNANDGKGNYTAPLQQTPEIPESTAMRKQDYTFKKLKNKLVFDNQALLYSIRGLDDIGNNDKTQIACYVPDVIQNELSPITVSAYKSDADNIYQPISYKINDQSVVRKAVKVTVAKNSEASGKPIILWFSNNTVPSKPNIKSRYLLKMSQQNLVYYLEKINGEYITSDTTETEK